MPNLAPRCRLLSLPRELRDTIYTFALSEFPVEITTSSPQSHSPGLLLAKKQLYAESITLYHKLLVATIEAKMVVPWLVKLPTKHIALIREIRVEWPTADGDTKLARRKDRAKKYVLLQWVRSRRGLPLRKPVFKAFVWFGDGPEDRVWTDEPMRLKWKK